MTTMDTRSLKTAIKSIAWCATRTLYSPYKSVRLRADGSTLRLSRHGAAGHATVTLTHSDVCPPWTATVDTAALLTALPRSGGVGLDLVPDGLAVGGAPLPLVSSNWPELEYPPAGPHSVTLDATAWAALARATAHAVDTATSRYYLCGTLLACHNGGLVAVATDGHRMSVHTVGPAPVGWRDVIAPPAVIAGLVALSKLHGAATLTPDACAPRATGYAAPINTPTGIATGVITAAGVRATVQLINGAYPHWQQVLLSRAATDPQLSIVRGDAITALRVHRSSDSVQLAVAPGEIRV